jgi:hypothetical protein
MAVTIDWPNQVVECTSSITDLPAFHAALRAAEDDAVGMLYPAIHTWKALPLGGGAFFYGMEFVNGWKLKFPVAGNYTIEGNLTAPVLPVAGVYLERRTSAAFTTTAVGGSGPSAAAIAAAVWSYALEAGLSAEQVQRVVLAALAGKSLNVGGSTETYLGQDGTTARIVATFDGDGNRTTVAVNGA